MSVCVSQTDIFVLKPSKSGNIVPLRVKIEHWHIFRQQATVKFN